MVKRLRCPFWGPTAAQKTIRYRSPFKIQADLWRDILDDAAKDAKEVAGKVQHRRLQIWLNPVKSDEDEGVTKVYVPTVQCKDDMLA